ncbi:MAG: DNA gyrase inhibitor YacG [Oligoflexia bacterium]|nr:DNA gyrase inhibitor YacG [Oligoflexia bacterium]
MKVQCPQCKKETTWENNPTRPFCTERCKLIDLGDWAMEKHAVPSDHQPNDEDDSQPTSKDEEE